MKSQIPMATGILSLLNKLDYTVEIKVIVLTPIFLVYTLNAQAVTFHFRAFLVLVQRISSL